MKKHFRPRALSLAVLALALGVGPAFAQVPQHFTFTGRLVDALGDPLAGPVDLELRLFDAETAGTELYAELHSGVPLDVTGGFTVQFGLGTPLRSSLPAGSTAVDFYASLPRWLEVVVGTDELTPRHVIASVAWALVAQQANKIVPDPNAPRFDDCGDGTVADHQTGLQWEQKTGTVGTAVFCETADCPDPHDVNNRYEWSSSGDWTLPDGGAFTDFLEKLNDPTFGEADTANDVTGCFAGRCDWRLANIVELQTIQDCGFGPPCIDPIFGPTASSDYWSASTFAGDPSGAWFAGFDGGVSFSFKPFDHYVRAVRAGSCASP